MNFYKRTIPVLCHIFFLGLIASVIFLSLPGQATGNPDQQSPPSSEKPDPSNNTSDPENQKDQQAPSKPSKQKRQTLKSKKFPTRKEIKSVFPDVPLSFSQTRDVRLWAGIEKAEAAVDQMRLWISSDYGQSWSRQEPNNQGVKDENFYMDYQFPEEGVYGVYTTAIDIVRNEGARPESGTAPQLFVIVKQSKPEISLDIQAKQTILPPSKKTINLSWAIQDPYLDRESIRVQISRDGAKSWKQLNEATPEQSNYSVSLSEEQNNPVLFRIVARDKVGNQNQKQTNAFRRAKSWEQYHFQKKAGFPDLPFTNNSRTLQIEYSIPEAQKQSGKKPPEVMLFYSTDGGQTWAKGTTQPHKDPYITFKAPDDGIYDFYITYSYPGSEPVRPFPDSETDPDTKALVDTEPPSVNILHPKAGSTLKPGEEIDIIYQSFDAYLPEKPVSLFYSIDEGSTWHPIKEDLPDEGIYNWTIPEDASSNLRLKITARDRAGNETSKTSPGPIFLSQTQKDQGMEAPELINISNAPEPKTEEASGEESQKEQIKQAQEKAKGKMKEALYYRMRRQYSKAAEIYREVLSTLPGSLKALRGLGIALYNQERYGESETVYRSLLKKQIRRGGENNNKDLAKIHYNLGISLYMQQKWKNSAKHLEKAIQYPLQDETKYHSYKILLQIARQYLRQNKQETGVEILKKLQKKELSELPAIQKDVEKLLSWYQ